MATSATKTTVAAVGNEPKSPVKEDEGMASAEQAADGKGKASVKTKKESPIDPVDVAREAIGELRTKQTTGDSMRFGIEGTEIYFTLANGRKLGAFTIDGKLVGRNPKPVEIAAIYRQLQPYKEMVQGFVTGFGILSLNSAGVAVTSDGSKYVIDNGVAHES